MQLQRHIFLSLCILIGISTAIADSQQHFNDAVAAYADGDNEQARDAFQQALEHGHNAALHHNLGNTEARLGNNGQAILHYQRSLALDPTDPDTRANLELLYQRLQRNPPESNLLTSTAQLMSLDYWSWLAALCFWTLLFAIFFPRILNWRPAASWSLRCVSAGLLILCAVALAGYHQLASLGVVVTDDVPLQTSPSSHSKPTAFVREGETVRLGDAHGNFRHIELPSGRSGWVEADAVAGIWGNACFTCITGEAKPDEDYEIDEAIR